MESKLLNYNFRTSAYTPEVKTIGSIEYLVVPVIMMKDGVHSGSNGPLYHSIAELSKPDWDNTPIVVNHPQENGVYVSVNSDSVPDSDKVGFVSNTNTEDNKLKAEAWFDIDVLSNYHPQLLRRIRNGELMNVSVGVFTENIPHHVELSDGSIAEYEAINHIPDHLAILPDDLGACSVDDGCGLRANNDNSNNKKGGEMNVQELIEGFDALDVNSLTDEQLSQFTKKVKPLGLGIVPALSNNDLQINQFGFLQIAESLSNYLDTLDTAETYFYLEEILDGDYLIYRMSNANRRNPIKQYYKQKYLLGNDGAVSFEGAPTPVAKNVTYDESVTSLKRTKFNNNNKTEEENSMKNQELVESLIANTTTQFTENDAEWLQSLSEEQLVKLTPKEVEVNTQNQNPLDSLSDEDKAALEYGKTQLQNHRQSLISSITANTEEGTWEEAELTSMSNEVLEKIAKSVKPAQTGVYVGEGLSANNHTPEILLPVGVNVSEEK